MTSVEDSRDNGSEFTTSLNSNQLTGKPTKSYSRQKAIAALDLLLHDISQTTEKVKREEKAKLQSCKAEPQNLIELKHSDSISSFSENKIFRKCKSLDSISNFDDQVIATIAKTDSLPPEESWCSSPSDTSEFIGGRHTSFLDTKYSSCFSNQAFSPNTCGLKQLDHLCNILEQYEQQNYDLCPKAHAFSWTKVESPSLVSLSRKAEQNKKVHPLKSNSLLILSGKVPKKVKSSFPLSNKEKPITEIKHLTVTDIDTVGICDPKISGNSVTTNVQNSYTATGVRITNNDDEARASNAYSQCILKLGRHCSGSENEFATSSSVSVAGSESPCVTADQLSSPASQRSFHSQKSDFRHMKNLKNFAEWNAIQQLLPTSRAGSNLALLSQLNAALSTSRHHLRRSAYLHSFMDRQYLSGKSAKTVNLFLPGFTPGSCTTTCSIAHAMTNQTSMVMSASELNLLNILNVH